MSNGGNRMLPVEYCLHDDCDIIAASIVDDMVARDDDKLLADFKER